MKKWNRILTFAVTLAALCAGLASFAQDKRFSMVPDNASMVIGINFNKMFSCPTFKALADSGDFLSIRDDLNTIPWNDSGIVPDPLLVYTPRTGFAYAALVDADNDLNDLAAQLVKLNGTKKTVETSKYGVGELITVKIPKIDRETQKTVQKTEAEILRLAPHTAVFARGKYPLDVSLFSRDTLPASDFDFIRNMPENVVIAGIMRQFPLAPGDDLTGLSSLVKSGDFIVSEYEPGAALFALNLECKGEKEARTAARRMNSIVRVVFVTLFAVDIDLFKQLNKSLKAKYSGTTATIEIRLRKSTIDDVRAFYLADRSIISTVTNAVKKPEDSDK